MEKNNKDGITTKYTKHAKCTIQSFPFRAYRVFRGKKLPLEDDGHQVHRFPLVPQACLKTVSPRKKIPLLPCWQEGDRFNPATDAAPGSGA
jgi:hypothetical protein